MLKKLTLPLTLVVLVGLYPSIDRQALLGHFRQLNVPLFLLALCLFVPQVLVTAWRWCWMVADVLPRGLAESTRLILASKALNAVVPSKLGEMSKAYFLHRRSQVSLSRGTALVLLEKVVDTGGLGTRDAALILLFAPYESASVMAGVGLLCSLRYWVDTLLGLPFFHRYSLERT